MAAAGKNLDDYAADLISGSYEIKDGQTIEDHEKEIEELAQKIEEGSGGHQFEESVYGQLKKKVKEGKFETADMGQMTVMHLAAIDGTPDLMNVLLKRWIWLLKKNEGRAEDRGHLDLDVNAQNAEGRTPLHLAALIGKQEMVEFLVTKKMTKKKLRGDVEDNLGQTAYEIAVELEWHDIVRSLLVHDDVTRYLEEKRSQMSMYGNGINAILVGAALIASITFAGWLQPPLGYQPYFNYPRNETMASSPPGTFEQYATVSEHLPVKVFWISNSLSFYCAIASILAGAAALVPRTSLPELAELRRLRGAVYLTAYALSWAVLFVVMAFSAAGFAALPPILKYEVYMIVTLVLGLITCLHGFIGARLSDPLLLQKVSFIIDPTFYFSRLSFVFERICEFFCGSSYQSFETRQKKRRERYNPVIKTNKGGPTKARFACLPCLSTRNQNQANVGPQAV